MPRENIPQSLRPSVSPSQTAPSPTYPLHLDQIPDQLRRANRWLLWRNEHNRAGMYRRMSYTPTGKKATRKDAATWSSFAAVASAYQRSQKKPSPFDGLAFAVGDGFCALQLNQILDVCGTPHPWVTHFVNEFASYSEIGPEGLSLTIICHGPLKSPFGGIPGDPLSVRGHLDDLGPFIHPEGGLIEVGIEPRFVTITGRRWPEESRFKVEHRESRFTDLLTQFQAGIFPKAPTENVAAAVPSRLFEPAPASAHSPDVAAAVPSRSVNDDALFRSGLSEGIPAPAHLTYQENDQYLGPDQELLPTEGSTTRPWQSPPGDELEPAEGSPPLIPSTHHPLTAFGEAATPPLGPSSPLPSSSPSRTPEKNLADQLVELALAQFRVGRTRADDPFAVELEGPNIAYMLRGGSDQFRRILAARYRRCFGRIPNATALSDALNIIQHEAGDAQPEEVALRVAPLSQTLNPEPGTLNSQSIVIDLGRIDGRAVLVTDEGWTIADRSPVLFRRTSLTGELPLPVRGGRLARLRSLINVSDEAWPMLRGWLVAALFPSIAHPILLLGGPQGTGKSTALRMLVGLVDPSAVPLRTEPGDSEQWAAMAYGSWCVALDNISTIPNWFSDALCKAVTGDGFVRRRLYTDGDISILEFRRLVAMTSVHPGHLAGDLADRVLFVDLDSIDESTRLPESQLLGEFEALRAELFGALLDEVAAVLRRLPHLKLDRLPRMADFARILAALPVEPSSDNTVDTTPATTADSLDAMDDLDDLDAIPLTIYLDQNKKLASEVIESDSVASALTEFMQSRETWQGTATELLAALKPQDTVRGWPKAPQYLTARLNLLTQPLRTMGIHIEYVRDSTPLRTRRVHLTNKRQRSVAM